MRPTGYQRGIFDQNNRGILSDQSITNQDAASSSDMLNFELGENGSISKRKGYIRKVAQSLGTNILGIYNFKQDQVGNLFLVIVVDDKIYAMEDFDGNVTDITGAVSLTSGANNFVSFAVLNDTLIGTNGVDAPWKWTGTGNAATLSISEFTLAKYVLAFKNRLVFLATTESGVYKPNRTRWSDVATIETYTGNNFTDRAESDDGSEIRGAKELDDDVFIFKSGSGGIKKLYYTGNDVVGAQFAMFNLGDVGTTSHRSIIEVISPILGKGLLYFSPENKVRFFNGSASVSITNSLDSSFGSLNSARIKYICAGRHIEKDQIFFCVSTGSKTQHDYVWVYDINKNAFYPYNDINANSIAVASDTNDNSYLMFGTNGGVLMQYGSGDADDGQDFESYYWSAWLNLGDSTLVKKIRWMQVYLGSLGNYNVNIGYNFNFADGVKKSKAISMATGEATFPFTFPITLGGKTVLPRTVELFGTGRDRFVRYKFWNNNKDEPVTVYRFDVLFKTLGVKRII